MEEISCNIRVRAVILKNSKILLVKEDKEQGFETPGGGVRGDETLYDALKREILEETGLDIKIKKIVSTILMDYPDGHKSLHILFKCIPLKKISKPFRDIQELKWFSKKEIKEILKNKQAHPHDREVFKLFVNDDI